MAIEEHIEKGVEGASKLLEKEADEVIAFDNLLEKGPRPAKRRFWNLLGPGLITGAADDDPSGIATYSQAGASTGFTYLWLAAFTFPLMAFVQEMCARIALVTGRGLASNMRRHFGKNILIFATILLFAANTFNIGADLAAMAEASQLILPIIPSWVYVLLIGIASMILEVFISYKKYSSYLKWLTFILVSYILAGFVVHFDLTTLLHAAFVPNFHADKSTILIITAILGTTISPYLFFWQTSQEVEEEIEKGARTIRARAHDGPEKIAGMRFDVWFGMFFSNLVMFFIVAVCAQTLWKHGVTNIDTAAQAAVALRPFAGNAAYLFFALGIIGTGLLALPVLAGSSAYAIAESFGWKEGLYHKLHTARSFYGVIILSMLGGLLIPFLGVSPIKVLIYSAIANGLVAPIMIIFIVILSSNEAIMGARKNSKLSNFVGWFVVILMSLVALASLWQIFVGF